MCPPEARTQAEIRELYMTISVYQNIVGLDITMNEAHLMNTFYSTRQFGYVKPVNE
jgi:hypothetical protein